MALQECGNGHLYDTDQFASCPYCNGGGNRIDFGAGPGSSEIGATVAPAGYRPQESNIGKTVGVFQKKMSFDPVVGWLVCIEGPEKGKDYKILAKNNTIGRGEQSDICLKGDSTISRENHARLAYDTKHNTFHVIPGDGANSVYLNDEPVYVPSKLSERDIIEIGDFKLMFVPFCNDSFTWKTEKKSGVE